MKLFLIFLGILQVALGEYATAINGTDKTFNPLVYVASADGKTFFMDTLEASWSEASAHAQDRNMRLASITSAAQFEALANSVVPDFAPIGQGYWIGGRDAQEIRQFSWEDSRTQPDQEFLPFRKNSYPYQNCMFLERGAAGMAVLSFERCSYKTKFMLVEN